MQIPFIYIPALATFVAGTGEFTEVKVKEREIAQLSFSYPCESTTTLQFRNRSPFYSSANREYLSLLPNRKLKVVNENNVCSLNLTIDPALRNDAGAYIAFSYKDGQYIADARVRLDVNYPPGRVSCAVGDHIDEGVLVSIQCTAPLGTLPGQISCFQNGTMLSPINLPQESDGSLTQAIQVNLTDYVVCCSSTVDQTVDRCECNDWGWDPKQDIVSNINPCPEDLSTEDLTLHVAPTVETDNASAVSALNPRTNSTDSTPPNRKYVKGLVTIAIFLLISIVAIIALIVYITRRCNSRRHPDNTSAQEYSKVTQKVQSV